ncbi:MAG: MFS transporter [Planctomycetota bacterium]|jgi:nucleoside transporter
MIARSYFLSADTRVGAGDVREMNRMETPRLSAGLNARLSIMMFLQYGIWGAWLPLLWPFLHGHRGFEPGQIGDMFAVGAVGALVAPFIAGQIADRYFSTEKYLGLSHILGGVLVWQLAWMESYWSFLAFSLLYSLIYAPTLSLTNSLSFHHLPDRDRDFGRVRVWGTVGWIVVGITIGQWLLYRHSPPSATDEALRAAQYAGMADAFRLSGLLGVLMGLYCFTLPRTPPTPGKQKIATFEAMGEIRRNPLLTLFLLAVPISCIHQFYFVHTADFLGNFQTGAAEAINRIFGVGGGGLMTVGQMSEILVLAAIPLIAKKVSRKTLLLAGVVAYALRMFLFAFVQQIHDFTGLPEVAILIAGVSLHGFCFGCFIFVAFMIVDEETTGDVKASAQSLFNVVIVGVGIIVGSKLATGVADWVKDDGGAIDYQQLFSYPMWASLACLLILLVFYPGGRRAPRTSAPTPPQDPGTS